MVFPGLHSVSTVVTAPVPFRTEIDGYVNFCSVGSISVLTVDFCPNFLISLLLVQFRFWLLISVLTSWFLFCWFNFCSVSSISVLTSQFLFCWSNFGSDDGTGNCRFVIMEFETEYWRRSPLIHYIRRLNQLPSLIIFIEWNRCSAHLKGA